MGGGAWPFLVGGAICLVNSVNERDLNLLNSRAYLFLLVGLRGSAGGGRLSIRAIPKLGTGGRGPLRPMRRPLTGAPVWVAGWAHARVEWSRVGRSCAS
jgi:hypothetical protein